MEAEAFSGSIVVDCDDGVEGVGGQVVEAGFSGEVSTEATDGVFDAAFLPWGVRIAEEGLDSELPFDAVMAGKFGAIAHWEAAFRRAAMP
nr:hypothetical protein [Sphingopyxis indica]